MVIASAIVTVSTVIVSLTTLGLGYQGSGFEDLGSWV